MYSVPTVRCVETASPASEPVTLAEAKAHLRVDDSNEDSLISALIVAARQYCESRCGRSLAQRTYRATLDRFPAGGQDIVLPKPPLISVQSIAYYKPDGTLTTMTVSTDYRVETTITPGRIRTPLLATGWPDALYVDDAITVNFTAGAASAPQAAKQAMLLLVGHWHANRESVVTGTITSALQMTTAALMNSIRLSEVMP